MIFILLFILVLVFISCSSHNTDINDFQQIETRGQYIVDVTLDKSAYEPNDSAVINLELRNPEDTSNTYSLDIVLKHLFEVIEEFSTEISLNQQGDELFNYDLVLPDKDFTGYALEIYLYLDEQLIDYSMAAIDVSSSWNIFPRYGYLTNYSNTEYSTNLSTISQLKDYYINGLMYYDVVDRHDSLLAGTINNPDQIWHSINNDVVRKGSLDDLIEISHQYNMNSFVYELMFGAYEDYQSQGIDESWGLYLDSNHQNQDFHQLPESWETSKLYLFNPQNNLWQDYLIGEVSNFLEVYDFDGVHLDSLGNRGLLYDYQGNIIFLDNTYADFLNVFKQKINTSIIFNPVSSYGLEETLDFGENAIIYLEIWGGTYYTLHKTLTDINEETSGEIGTVLAAYMNYGNYSGYFNNPGVLLTNAVIMASGGSHMELGDKGMLSNEYFPADMLNMDDELVETLQAYYTFQVAYENYLRGPNLTESENQTIVDGHSISEFGQKGKIWSFSRQNSNNYEMLHFINLENVDSLEWADEERIQTKPEKQIDLSIKHYVSRIPSQVLYASPDDISGIMTELNFQFGSDKIGDYITFTLPSLDYYSMIVLTP